VASGKGKVGTEEILQADIALRVINGVPTVYAHYPDAYRRFEKWRKIIEKRVGLVRKWLA